MMRALHDGRSKELFVFYRRYCAMLRARPATAHLLETNGRQSVAHIFDFAPREFVVSLLQTGTRARADVIALIGHFRL